jgi:cytochrome c oxidase assembly factor CtaG
MGAGVWSAWSAPGLAVVPLCAAVIVYLRGWNRLRRAEPWRWTAVRPVCFVAGVALIGIALWSPLDALASRLLAAHMTQHMLLAMVAPPLLLLGWPFSPMLLGLPQWVSRDLLGPLLGSPGLQRAARWLVHPPVAWVVAVVHPLHLHLRLPIPTFLNMLSRM